MMLDIWPALDSFLTNTRTLYKGNYKDYNKWEPTFAYLPRRIEIIIVQKGVKSIRFDWFWLTPLERKYSVVQGSYKGVIYRTVESIVET